MSIKKIIMAATAGALAMLSCAGVAQAADPSGPGEVLTCGGAVTGGDPGAAANCVGITPPKGF
jgi:hypothetical protein